jgi:hypothetical protein
MSKNTVDRRCGRVEKIEFTQGGMGNQWTTISGTRYCTFWDIRVTDWKQGDWVSFAAFDRPVFSNTPSVLQANEIHKVKVLTVQGSHGIITTDAEGNVLEYVPDGKPKYANIWRIDWAEYRLWAATACPEWVNDDETDINLVSYWTSDGGYLPANILIP